MSKTFEFIGNYEELDLAYDSVVGDMWLRRDGEILVI